MREQNTNDQFKLYIPNDISSDSNLNLTEMRVLATIKALDKDKSCFATNSYIAKCLNMSSRHVSRTITALEKKGYIALENKNSFKRKISMITKQEIQREEPVSHKENPIKQVEHEKTSKPKDKTNKLGKFSNIYRHNWDFEEIARLERKYIDEKLKSMTLTDRGKELINKIGASFSEHPSEWQGITQLAFKG